jgi:antitoxin PrlF
MATTLTTKGQVTIPKPIRDRLGIGPGSAVEFEIAQDGRVIRTRQGNGGVVLSKL